MRKPKASGSKIKGQMPLAYYLNPPSTTKVPADRKRDKQPPTTSSQDDFLVEDNKNKIKENVSPVTSPHNTPKRRRLQLQALGSETNVFGDVETPAQDESSKARADADKEGEVIQLSDSSTLSSTNVHVGLPTPVTALKPRTGAMQRSTPTPAQKPSHQPSVSTHTPHMRTRPPDTLQQPTPDTAVRAVRMSIASSPPARVSSDSPPTSRISSARRMPTAGPFEIVASSQGSQDLELNPFIDGTGSEPTMGGLFKLPSLPARLQHSSSLSLDTSGAPSSPTRYSKLHGISASAVGRTPSKSERDMIVPSSQGDEDELEFWSPGKNSHTSESRASSDFVPPSIPAEEELSLSSSFNPIDYVLLCSPITRLSKSARPSLVYDSSESAHNPASPVLPQSTLPEPFAHSPHTPKRKTVTKHPFTGGVLPFGTSDRTPAADSGHGASVSPEKDIRVGSQTMPKSPLDESQTQPESPLLERIAPRTPRSHASSITVPESPRSPFKTLSKLHLFEADGSQTQPESPCSCLATPSRQALRDHRSGQEDAFSSQTAPESPQSPIVKTREHEMCRTEESAQSSQTVPESPQWRVPTPNATPSQKTRGYLPDDENPFAPIPSSLPFAEYPESEFKAETSTQAGLACSDAYDDGSQTQPDAWPVTPRNKRLMQRLQFIRQKYGAEAAERGWDMLSDTPLSIPSDFDEDEAMSEVGSELPSPVRDFFAMDM
ncbi:uncharacterized protein PHACADRAFT_181451 [Phanerochaete carnosa HHB-10118-sp]|uniref:Uncharacterized protein n=1 Tax=Phanerochaete carnosa (strain HHB-10118-sp) TaxID=650164 RepID=K5V9E6_PHACS|nr:uncharacterized protein PHACADRAFT_181451 [Phanerochaete carnosa HHB-10118-sp]EKM59446.1 hypothetical protein PHACADRAFT_181451 [Phanerochaete carnosa HHB-10118-sp]